MDQRADKSSQKRFVPGAIFVISFAIFPCLSNRSVYIADSSMMIVLEKRQTFIDHVMLSFLDLCNHKDFTGRLLN